MIEAHAERDLACPDLWASSLERSLSRRKRPRRASTELATLLEPRDLTEERFVRESLSFAQNRRRVADQLISMPDPAARKLSIAGMIATVAGPGALALATWHQVTKGHHATTDAAAAEASTGAQRRPSQAARRARGPALRFARQLSAALRRRHQRARRGAEARGARRQRAWGAAGAGPARRRHLRPEDGQRAQGVPDRARAEEPTASWARSPGRSSARACPSRRRPPELLARGQGDDRHRRLEGEGPRPARRRSSPSARPRPQRRRRLRPEDRARSQALPAAATA